MVGPVRPRARLAVALSALSALSALTVLLTACATPGPANPTPPTAASTTPVASPATTSTAASPTPAGPATASATPSASPTSGAATAPSEPSSPDSTPSGPDESLARNAIYRVDLGRRTVSCRLKVRSPKPPLRSSALAPYLRTVVKCLVETFDTPLADVGFDLGAPRVRSYRRSVKTPCGTFAQTGAPAFYCSATRTIYWPLTSDDGNEAYTFARLGYVGLTAHEFGHHLQASSGMLADYSSRYYAASKQQRYRLSRRLELQAQCFEGVFLAATANSIHLTANDRAQLHTWHGYTGDEDPPRSRKPDHGTSAAQIRWLDRGLNSGDLGRCNTWTAPSSAVK